jgi:hypothetical protein
MELRRKIRLTEERSFEILKRGFLRTSNPSYPLKKVYEELEEALLENIPVVRKALEEESEVIQKYYESAMTRRRTYVYGGLGDSVAHPNSDLYIYDPLGNLYLGCFCGYWQPEDKIFITSHFAPSGIRKGVDLLKLVNGESSILFVLMVTGDLAEMLQKANFVYTGYSHEVDFQGELQDKFMFVNQAALLNPDFQETISSFVTRMKSNDF